MYYIFLVISCATKSMLACGQKLLSGPQYPFLGRYTKEDDSPLLITNSIISKIYTLLYGIG